MEREWNDPLGSSHGRMPRVSVVLPTLNEARNLPHIFPRIPADVYEIVLVDGASVDGTAEVARELFPDVRILAQSGRGKGNALAAGFRAARGEIIVMIDADGSMRPEEIPNFVAALRDGADFAKGSRFTKGAGSADITWLRKAGNWFLTAVANRLYGSKYTDITYGYCAFWAHCLPAIDNIDECRFDVDALIKVRIARAGLEVTEVPSFEEERIHGESNLNAFRDGWFLLRSIVRERKRVIAPVVQAPAATEAAMTTETGVAG
jgi:glycosyltransferase involved in cell wall biosynthesis